MRGLRKASSGNAKRVAPPILTGLRSWSASSIHSPRRIDVGVSAGGNGFAAQLSAWAVRTDQTIRDAAARFCMDLTAAIIMGTPVDTGRARNSWVATLGAPYRGQVRTTDKTGGRAIARAQKTAEAAPGGVFYLTNNLPYIRRLEYDGWSKQAPRGMVRIAVARALAQMRIKR